MPQCFVTTCRNYYGKTRATSKVIYHMFPSSPALALKWAELCGHEKNTLPPPYSRVCSDHFSSNAYQRDLQHELLGLPLRKKLNCQAVPDRNLPSKTTDETTLKTIDKTSDNLTKSKIPCRSSIRIAKKLSLESALNDCSKSDLLRKLVELESAATKVEFLMKLNLNRSENVNRDAVKKVAKINVSISNCEYEFSEGKSVLSTRRESGKQLKSAKYRKTKGGSVRYHRFPGDPSTRSQWLKACGRHVQNCATARICSRHFTDTSYERDVQHELLGLPTRCRLKKGALPEINLPFSEKEELPSGESSNIAVLLAVGLVPTLQPVELTGGGLPQDLNKMHVMEDVREGSDVPGAQPSSPGHAEQRPDIEEPHELGAQANNENCIESDNKQPSKFSKESAQANGTDETKTNLQDINNIDDTKNKCGTQEGKQLENDTGNSGESLAEKESGLELESNSAHEDAGSNDSATEESQYSKRKLDTEESPAKRMRSELEQNYILRDKILNEYIDAAGCSSIQQIQNQMDQILSEIRTLNELAKEKEKEWNNIIHLKKIKEELLLRIQRRKQIMILNNDKIDWNEHEASPEPQTDILEERLRHSGDRNKQAILKHNITNANNSGLVIFSTSSQGSGLKIPGDSALLSNKQKNSLSKQFPNTIIEINGQSGDLKQNRQRPVLDVQSIIADYRQRHPEAVPRRGRRIRSLLNSQGDSSMVKRTGREGVMNFSSISLGSGSQVKHNLNAAGIEANSELGLLLTAVDNQAKQAGSKSSGADGQAHLETTSFKDVLMQFAKLSQHERQDLLQTAMKPPPYSEVTVHPVPAHTQSASNSLLHGILTKAQSRSDNSKSTFSPTLARLLTAPERAAASSPHANNHSNVAPVSISDMLSNNKARNEITITPVGGQFDITVKEKSTQEEEEAEDSADRLVIDESEALDARNRMDNGSDAGDEVPQCQGCNQKPAQFVCAGCGNQWYCSRECQVVAWDEHSEVCSG